MCPTWQPRAGAARSGAWVLSLLLAAPLPAVAAQNAAAAPAEATGETPQQSTADSAAISVPSGQPVTLSEVLLDETPGALWARFRFVAPQLAALEDPAASGADIDHLCATLAVPYLSHYGIAPERVVISLSERALAFGTSAPGMTQYFETYRIDGSDCVWEGF